MYPAKSDSRRRLNATGGAAGEYSKVPEDRTEIDGFVNEQWTVPSVEEPTPWKTIGIILALFCGGTISIGCAVLDWFADVQEERSDRIWALVIIGVLTIIPGGYYFFVLSCIILQRPGYSWDDIRRLG
ncbi:hypothetical protein KR222_006518 [Zaprionus bogoriensis]|nr:hypothetical protein KR222_006518 [Zaprionus bogoriensis]